MRFPDLLSMLRAAVAEYGSETAISELPTGPLPDDGYARTEPGPVGAARTALLMHIDEHGPKLSLVQKEKELDDVQRASLKKLYGNRARIIRATGTYRGASTDELTENPNEAIETPYDRD